MKSNFQLSTLDQWKLHLICLRHDRKFAWHLAGLWRPVEVPVKAIVSGVLFVFLFR